MRLSICIPTYNRAHTLRRLLDSILAQIGDAKFDHDGAFEIAISDNASTDDTADVVAGYIKAGLPITYHRFDENRGFDRNLLNAIGIASGEYCWLFGSDDFLEQDALSRVWDILERHRSVTGISVGSQGYSPDLFQKIFVNDHISTEFTMETTLYGRNEIVASIGPWMGFISSLIVRRQGWLNAVQRDPIEPYMNGYIHLYLCARMLDEHSAWLCVPDRLVGCRTGNESFLAKDEFARTRLDIEGYDLAFGATLGRENPAYRRAMAKVAGFYIRTHFLGAKLKGASSAYWKQAIPMSVAHYWRYPTFWTKTFPVVITPRFIMLGVRAAYRGTVKPVLKRRRARS